MSLGNNKQKILRVCRRLCVYSKPSIEKLTCSPIIRKVAILYILKTKVEARREHKLPFLHLFLLKVEDFCLSVSECNRPKSVC